MTNYTVVNGVHIRFKSWDERITKTRVYVPYASDEEVSAACGIQYSDLKWTVRGEDSDMDALWDKWNRTLVMLTRPRVTETLNAIGIEGMKFSFSRKAGCGCGCSPGFILQRMLRMEGREVAALSAPDA